MVVDVKNNLLKRQLAKSSTENGQLNIDILLSLVDNAYEEADKERRLTDRSMALMSQELLEVNQGLQSEAKKLKAMQERYILAAHGANDGLWDWDIGSGKVYYSPRWKEMLGYEEETNFKSLDDWLSLIHPDYLDTVKNLLQENLEGQKERFECEYMVIHRDGHPVWILTRGIVSRDTGGKAIRMAGSQTDITKRKEDEAKLQEASQLLASSARAAGMAEVATNVLHNIGNILNTLNTSATILSERITHSKVSGLIQLKKLLELHKEDFPSFVAHDPKGKILPTYLRELAEYWELESQFFHKELTLLNQNIEHVKDCIAMQQSLAGTSGMVEPAQLSSIMENVLLMQAKAIEGAHIRLVRDFQDLDPSLVDRVKTYQIFMNLVQNAKHALMDVEQDHKVMTITIKRLKEDRVTVSVQDNGIGITKENLSKIFNHGFTTKKNGHGFGLHYCALAAKEMGGELIVTSDGPYTGATFTLQLPYIPHKREGRE